MNPEYRENLNALSRIDPRWSTACTSLSIYSRRERALAANAGLGEVVVQRRQRKAANRARVNAARRHSRATR